MTLSTLPPPVSVESKPWPQALLDVLERQHSLLDALDELSRSQSALIAERRTDRLLELLSQRQSHIDEFTVCQAQMTVLSQDIDRRLAQVDTTVRERIRGLIGGIGGRLRELMQRDQQDQAALHAGRSAVMADMSSLDAGRAARAAYGPTPAGNANRYADQKG